MKNDVFITVYILNKNYGCFLEKCIDSLLDQTCSRFELLIIDNKSDDNSHQLLLDKYSSLNIVYLEKSLRLTEVGNMISSICKGTHFIRLDADDWVEPDFIESFYTKLYKNDAVAAIFPNYHEVNIDGSIIKTVKRFDFDSEVDLFDLPAHGACTLISNDIFKNIGGYDESLDRQDGYDLWLKLIKNYKVSNISKALFYYRQHNLNLTKSQKKLLEVRTNILYKNSLKEGLDLKDCVYVISIQRSDDLFGVLSNMKFKDRTVLNNMINNIHLNDSNPLIFISSESEKKDFNIEFKNVQFFKRKETNQSLKDSLIDIYSFIEKNVHRKFKFIVSLTIDYPFLDSHYILAAISYINYFNTNSVDSVCIEDSLLYKHSGKTLIPVYNNTITRFERDTLYRKAGGINVIRTDKLTEYDGISTSKTGHIIIDKLSALRADNSEVISLIK